MRSYSDYLHGKHVAIIGGAASFDENAFDADVIIRINEHLITQGGRGDVVYCALANNPKIFFDTGKADHLRWFMADRRGRWFNSGLEGQFKAHGARFLDYSTRANEKQPPFEEFWLQRILFQYRCKPFTGIVAAVHALSLPAKSVYLTGCTFYAQEGKLPLHRDNHFIKPNQEIVKDLLKYDKRFSVDAACKLTFDFEIDETL